MAGIIPYFDERSADYKVDALIADSPKHLIQEIGDFQWPIGKTPFQGNASTCVVHGFQNEFRAGPDVNLSFPTITKMHNASRAQGEKNMRFFSEGTTVTDMAHVCKHEFGLIDSYLWILDTDPEQRLQKLLSYVVFWGGVIIGSKWYDGMKKEEASISGKYIGNHCWYIMGVNFPDQKIYFQGSYGGKLFGKNRNFIQRLSFSDLKYLLKFSSCEACCVLTFPQKYAF